MPVVVITGVSSGIGKDLAELLISKGFTVYGLARRDTQIAGLNFLKCDVTDLNNIENVRKIIEEKEHKIDILINNAGMGIAGSIIDSNYEDIEKIFKTNVMGVIAITKEFLPLINDGGKIINVGSVAGDLTIPYQGFYSMSKSAVDKFSECLSIELKSRHIKVTTILPGDTKTGFTESRKTVIKDDKEGKATKSIKKMEKDELNGVSPRKVSKVILKVIKRKNPPIRVAVGFSYKLVIFLQRILPRKLVLAIIKIMYS
ncbi:MAG: SDR family NAD(P)-dependent oxidoreductase [Erysipelotrichales bacterium]|nr:SDR family NAD(P)-dependent oxidoreductase [Erysipelotrichales bacterium]